MHWPELTAAIEEFRAVLGRTLDIAAGLSDEQAGKRVRTGTWSVAEVLDHLVRAEVAFRKYQRQAVERAWAGATGTIRIGFREVDTRLRPLPMSWMPLLAPVLFGLDESFAALDPSSLQQCLETVLRRAPSLLVIAHP